MKYFYLSLHPDLKFNYTLNFSMLAQRVDVSRAKIYVKTTKRFRLGFS